MQPRSTYFALSMILLVFAALSCIGITWGLPSRSIDKYLFADGEVWSGEKIYRLANAGGKFSGRRGADVDVDPIDASTDAPIPLTAREEDVAKIYLRYRLYTNQPDEMITMMALAGMRPGSLDLDPRLYQYGGLFIYPVGALIKMCGILGLIEVRGDVAYYLDRPDEFGKFYIVARGYAAAWGLVGVLIVFAIARRLGGSGAGLLAALLFTLMPVVACMAHEGKPHLPGAVLMLAAVLFAMRFTSGGSRRDWWLLCICCGAAFGMVLSSLPIFVLMPVAAWLVARRGPCPDDNAQGDTDGRTTLAGSLAVALMRTVMGVLVAVAVYLVTNPYIVINALFNRDVLRSNFGNSLAMYEIARLGEGFARVLELTVEGATLPILVLGAVGFIVAAVRRNGTALPLIVPAVVLFLQFVLIGAGKPAEYGRFGVFVNTALAIGSACLAAPRSAGEGRIISWAASAGTVIWVAVLGFGYLGNFRADAGEHNTRTQLAESIIRRTSDGESGAAVERQDQRPVVMLRADPAPYGCPPLPFSRVEVVLSPRSKGVHPTLDFRRYVLIEPRDSMRELDKIRRAILGSRAPLTASPHETPISWANKPFQVELLDWTLPGGPQAP